MSEGTPGPSPARPPEAIPRRGIPAGSIDATEVALSATALALVPLPFILPFIPGGSVPVALATAGVAVVLAALLLRHWRRALAVRRETLAEARAMLRERIASPLHTLLRLSAPPGTSPGPAERARIAEIANAVRAVEATLELLSDESLAAWRVAQQVDQNRTERRRNDSPGSSDRL